MKSSQFIRLFHRWSGLLLIVFLGLKIVSGYTMGGNIALFAQETAYKIHFSPWVDIPLLFLAVFHAAYGMLKIVLGWKVKNKALAFALANAVAAAVFVSSVIVLYLA